MNNNIIAVPSITYAMKGKEILKQYGIKAEITKIQMNKGCGYGLKLSKGIDKATHILKAHNIKTISHWRDSHDIS